MSRSWLEPDDELPQHLRIRFGRGERPYLFWVSASRDACPPRASGPSVYKILTKRMPDQRIEALVLQEALHKRWSLAHVVIPADSPAGWLDHWVGLVAEELGTHFQRFDLGSVETRDEWNEVALRLGWLRR